MRIFRDVEGLQKAVGERLGESDWLAIDQDRVDGFADATGDHQWIHVDPERARNGPFGTTIAHGFLTLSLIPAMVESALEIRNLRMSINYGLNRVRFPAPVPVDSRLRARVKLLACDPMDDGGTQTSWLVTVEREGSDRPVCVAETVARRYA